MDSVSDEFVERRPLPEFDGWRRARGRRIPLSFDLEVTARCNNDCRHCYINLPADDCEAAARELSLEEILRIAGEAVELGAIWCLVTGGEPLLRRDFAAIYSGLTSLGLLVSVFTNACLVRDEHVRLFRDRPPRNLEVSVYGATRDTYERVTRRPGSFGAFRRGVDRLLEGGVPVRFKAMALRSNVHELPEIAAFCRARTGRSFRFDPLLHLRYDGDAARNDEIRAERLSGDEIVAIEQADEERRESLRRGADTLIGPDDDSVIACGEDARGAVLFRCGAGTSSFAVSDDGRFRLCSSLWQPDTLYDLRRGTLRGAWEEHVPRVLALRSDDPSYLARCARCALVNLCLWCPAHAYLETGRLDAPVDAFCAVAQARRRAVEG